MPRPRVSVEELPATAMAVVSIEESPPGISTEPFIGYVSEDGTRNYVTEASSAIYILETQGA